MITLQKCGACNGTNVVTESSKIVSLTQNLKRICGKCINGLLEVDDEASSESSAVVTDAAEAVVSSAEGIYKRKYQRRAYS
jgi:DnaJ-class molecular chaperone